MNGLRRINSQRQEDLGLHNEKLQHFMFKWKKMSQCRSSQAQRRKNQERGRLVYFLFLHTVLFSHSLMNYMTSLSVLLPRLNNSKLVLCFRWILVYSLLFVSSVFFWLFCQKWIASYVHFYMCILVYMYTCFSKMYAQEHNCWITGYVYLQIYQILSIFFKVVVLSYGLTSNV